MIKSEFAKLSDLAIAQGVSHSELIAEIQQTIFTEYRKKYPNSPIGIAVLIDESTGLIRIFSGKDDITPEEFSLEANQIARQIVIDRLTNSPPVSTLPRKSRFGGIFPKIFFWGYNIYFFLFNISVAISYLHGQKFFSSLKDLGIARTILFVCLFLLPVVSILFAIRRGLQRSSSALMQLFFLFEVPLALFAYISLSLIGQTSLFISLTLMVLLTIPFLLYLNISNININVLSRKIIIFFGQMAAVFSTYYTFLLSFFVLPIIVTIVKFVFDNVSRPFGYQSYGNYTDYSGVFFSLGWGFLLITLVLVLLSIPYFLTISLWRSLGKNRILLLETLGDRGFDRYSLISWSLIIFLIALSIFRWPDNHLLSELANFPTKEVDYQIQEKAATSLTNQESKLKNLVTQKLDSRSYYPFSEDDDSIEEMYQQAFDNKILGSVMQSVFIQVAYPLVYREGSTGQDTLSQNFTYVFGYPYYQKENLKSNDNGNKDVLLTFRHIKINPDDNGLLASVTIEEEFENKTYSQKEVVYEFNLPSEATIYNLKLGPNLEFPGIIAPKGAAQKTYERELLQRRDPALLEQTGPNQYRLRIFPIPAKNDNSTLKGKRQKVSFSYVIAQNNGTFALPLYSKKLNVFSDASSTFTLENNGKIAPLKETETKIDIARNIQLDLCQPQSDSTNFQGLSNQVKLIYHANDDQLKNIACQKINTFLPLLKNYRTAIIYDTSFNNKDNNILSELNQIINNGGSDWLDNSIVDFYKLNNLLSHSVRLNSNNYQEQLKPVYFSKVADFSKLGNITEKYDLVLIITGQNISFNQLSNFPFSLPTTVYWIGETKIPPLNLEMTSGTWQSGGGSALSFTEAIQSFLLTKISKEKYGEGTVTINKFWSLQYSNLLSFLPDSVFSPPSNFANIANKGLQIKFAQNQNREIVGDITIMDELNSISEKSNIVSPYSSLIALVNEQQFDRLNDNINSYDRYQDSSPVENNQRSPIFGNMILSPSSSLNKSSSLMMGSNLESSGDGFSPLSSLSIGGSSSIFFVIFSIVISGIGFVFYLFSAIRKKK
ncbi:MAG: VIT domain-containing protein [Candidatus Shapirobacteria bacterium]